MGGFDTSVKGGDYFIGKIFEKSKLALLLHVADMKAITEDANASQESKDAANNALVEKAKMNDQESRVESEIRNKGYEDSLCMINENGNVKVYVKVNETLSEEDSASIEAHEHWHVQIHEDSV